MSDRTLLAVAPVPLWPADNGFSLRVTGLLRELVQDWDTVLVAPPSPDAADQTDNLGLLEYAPVDLGGSLGTMPWQLDIGSLRRAVDGVLARVRPNAVLLWSGTEVLGFETGFPAAVADRIDSATLAAVRMQPGLGSLKKRIGMATRAALYERRVVRNMNATVVVGEADARTLRRISQRRSVHVIPNGVELGPPPDVSWEADEPTVIFTGVLGFRPNADAIVRFAETVWPRVREAVPAARLAIVGRGPDSRVRSLREQPGIEVLPDVPDLRAELRSAWVAVAPMLSGGGIKNKVLEAWACGKPVVMSTLAANGLAPGYQDASATADSPVKVAAEVVRLLEDRARRRELGEAGYALVARYHSWSGAAHRISELLEAADRRGRQPAGDAPVSRVRRGA